MTDALIDEELAKLLENWSITRRKQTDGRKSPVQRCLEAMDIRRAATLAEEALVKWVNEHMPLENTNETDGPLIPKAHNGRD